MTRFARSDFIYAQLFYHLSYPCIVAQSSPSAFPKADTLDVHEYPVCIQSSLLAVKQIPAGCKVLHGLVVILSTSGSIIHSSVTTQFVFSHHFVASRLTSSM